jgi:EmrB/QacA subfamily drug resistance transporter
MPASAAARALTLTEVRAIILGLLAAMLLAALDQTIVATAIPTMGREMGDLGHMPWIVTGYLLAATVVTPLYGKLSDIHGRRKMLQIAISTFVVGSVACALSPSVAILSAARMLQGLGGGGLISLAQTIIADMIVPRELPRFQSYTAGVFVTASLAGPLLGGALAEHLHWSLIFWINVPLGFAAYWLTDAKLRQLPRRERPHAIDLVGAVMLVAATGAMLLALNWGGVRYGWTTAPILSLAATSIVFSLLFVWRTITISEPFIPLSVFSSGIVRAATLAACCGMGTFIGLTIYVPIYLEKVFALTASQTGIVLVPFMIGTVTGAALSNRLLAKGHRYKRLPILGLFAAIGAALTLALKPDRPPLALVEIDLSAISIGLGTMLPVCTLAIQNAVEGHQLGTATSVVNFFRQLGGAVSVATFGAIVAASNGPLQNAGLDGGLLRGTIMPAGQVDGENIATAFGLVYAIAAMQLGLALICMLALEERPLRSSFTMAA